MNQQFEVMALRAHDEHIVAETLRQLGLDSGERTYAQCCTTYGAWFKESVRAGKLQPCRSGTGPHPTKYYAVRDILSLKEYEYRLAKIQYNETNS